MRENNKQNSCKVQLSLLITKKCVIALLYYICIYIFICIKVFGLKVVSKLLCTVNIIYRYVSMNQHFDENLNANFNHIL